MRRTQKTHAKHIETTRPGVGFSILRHPYVPSGRGARRHLWAPPQEARKEKRGGRSCAQSTFGIGLHRAEGRSQRRISVNYLRTV